MTAALWVAWAATVVVAVAAVAVAPWVRQSYIRHRQTGERIVIYCSDTGEVLDGLRIGEDMEYIRLVDVHARGGPVPVAGAVGEYRFYKPGRRFYLEVPRAEQVSTLIPVPMDTAA